MRDIALFGWFLSASRLIDTGRFGLPLTVGLLCIVVDVAAGFEAEPRINCDTERRPSSGLSQLRSRGLLDDALESIDRELQSDPEPCREVALRLERARVLDRMALHSQTRPATAALEEIDQAQEIEIAAIRSASVRGAIELARAYYHYRAEMPNREFLQAEEAALRAIRLARSAGAVTLLADATHQLGLIRAQQGRTVTARQLFDDSLELDRQAEGEKDYMLGEYHRHIALTYIRDGDWSAALPHYVDSHEARLRSGALDGSQFSALSLGDALVNTGSRERALPYFEYANDVARQIDSTYVKALSSLRIADVLEDRGDFVKAREFYLTAAREAAEINRASLVAAAESGLTRLSEAKPEIPADSE